MHNNRSYGIKASGGLITENTIRESGANGIFVEFGGGVVARNVVADSASFGLRLAPTVGYSGNTLTGNNGGGGQVIGGINTGHNVCGAAVCPGGSL